MHILILLIALALTVPLFVFGAPLLLYIAPLVLVGLVISYLLRDDHGHNHGHRPAHRH